MACAAGGTDLAASHQAYTCHVSVRSGETHAQENEDGPPSQRAIGFACIVCAGVLVDRGQVMLQAWAREDDAHAHRELCVLIVLQLMNAGQNLVVRVSLLDLLQLLRAHMHQTHANAHPCTLLPCR